MHVRAFRVVNYKSFADSGEISLESGFNVIVGRNNVGKTALAEAAGLHSVADQPHRSLRTVPRPGAPHDLLSRVVFSVRVEPNELRDLLTNEFPAFYIPTDPNHADSGKAWLHTALSEGVTVEVVYCNGTILSAHLSNYVDSVSSGVYLQVTMDSSGEPTSDGVHHGDPTDFPRLDNALASKFFERLYYFSAVRFNISDGPISTNRVLASDASNLVQVLDLLSRIDTRWQRYFHKVKTVLPEVGALAFIPTDQGGSVRALLWNTDSDMERVDLAVPLSESGTGVGQVLAILYVVLTSEYSRTIVIDEPQSFLHPGAVRKLFEILKSYPQHQYVITTHSPNAVTAADPQALFLVRKEGEQSVIEQLDISETRDQARFLREVGASLSDVFGADNILWVEGATEEESFPLILSEIAERPLLGTKIVGVLSTGDLEGRRSRDVYRIYQRLAEAGGLVPPAVGFIFDREGRDKTQREDLERESDGLVAFTHRRMFENYLLNPGAIVHVASRTEGFHEDGRVAPEDVEEWIEEHGWDDKYFNARVEESARTHSFWLVEVDGAKVLKDMFFDLSETRVAYDKTVHGVELTRWLCNNAPEDLEELVGLIKERLDNHISR